MDLDHDLVREAAQALGTSRLVDTVHAALREAVRARQRQRLLELDTDLTLDALDRIRSWSVSPE